MCKVVLFIILFCVLSICSSYSDVETGLNKTAVLIAADITTNNIKLIGVTEFTNDSSGLGGNAGVAGKYFSEKFEEYLIKNRNGYKVVERMKLNSVIREGQFQASGITDPAASKDIIGKILGIDGLVLGSITRMGMKASISCKVVKLPEAEAVAKESFMLDLDSDLVSLFGDSIVASQGNAITPTDIGNQTGGAAIVKNISNCPFKVEVISNGKTKPIYTDDKYLYVEANDNEEYSIRIVNNTYEPVAAVLLIDGVNSLYTDGKPVRDIPSKCIPWVVAPTSEQNFIQGGWQINNETIRKFVFCSDISQTVAAKLGYKDELGMITAVIYPQMPDERVFIEERYDKGADFGTKEGREETAKINTVDFKYKLTPAAIITLRYCGKDKIASMRKL